MLRAQKEELVNQLTREIKEAKMAALVDYGGLTVKLQQDLKKKLSQVGARMVVVKNTLLKLAGKEAGIDEQALSDASLSGQTALVISSEDPISPLQILGKFAKEFELPKFKVGIVDGVFQDQPALFKLSTLPSREVLEGQVLGSIAAPLYGLVGVCQANMQKLVFILQAKVKGGDH